jgi:putative ABC transport system substrate-binding protein
MIRYFLLFTLGLAVALPFTPAWAQPPTRVPVVGLLITHPPVTDPVVEALRSSLRQAGYEDGRNIKLEVRTALGQLDRVPGLAEELVHLQVDVIVVANEVALRSVQHATSTIPIVVAGYTADPVAARWIESYRHPGGNITGVFNVNMALGAKRLEMLKETLPHTSRVAVLWDTFGQPQLEELQAAARALGVQLELIELGGPMQLEAAFKIAKRRKAGAVMMMWSPVFYVHRAQVAALGLEARLPTFTDLNLVVEAGCLLSYGSDSDRNWERVAYFIDRLLKGAKPADLPVEQISKLKLAVNLKTAKALGLTIPESILVRADEVIR